jgi:light-regulated signal transduction histidine kinase (bacteriophytochrome)
MDADAPAGLEEAARDADSSQTVDQLAIDNATERDAFTRLQELIGELPPERRAEAAGALAAVRAGNRRTEEELQELVYVASHDLTEPLRMVTSYLQLLDRRAGPVLDERSKEFMFYAVDGADRMKALIDDLLRYARVGSAAVTAAPVDLDQLLVEVKRDLGPAIAEAGADVQIRGPLPVIVADRPQLGQLLQNLISNAVKFRRPERGNTVVVAVAPIPGGGGWELTVADDGIGVQTDRTDRIWRAFQRLHAREEFEGNGIGLAICRRIAERHGGRIWVTPNAGGGSVFHVSLKDETAPDPAAPGPA